jgi:uncharacterized protein YkwD
MKQILLLSLGLALGFCGAAIAQTAPAPVATTAPVATPTIAPVATPATAPAATPATPAAMISHFRAQHGEGRVTLDPALDRIAQAQANAMAARDLLDHDALGPFSSRVAWSGADHAAENIAYGYDNFAKTLVQWIDSSEHRKNLLMHGASRVGIAHAISSKTHRTYWAMEIAGGYERPHTMIAKRSAAASTEGRVVSAPAKPRSHTAKACHIKLLGLCL